MKTRSQSLAAFLTAAFLAVSGQAFADDDRARIEAATQAKIQAVQAIDIAQKQFGGKATDLELKRSHGAPAYEVELRDGAKEHSVYIDAISGKVLGSKTENERKSAVSPAISLERAIEIAQGKVSGQVLDAELDDDRGRIRYEVKILSAADRVQHKVIIDANNGNVVTSYIDRD